MTRFEAWWRARQTRRALHVAGDLMAIADATRETARPMIPPDVAADPHVATVGLRAMRTVAAVRQLVFAGRWRDVEAELRDGPDAPFLLLFLLLFAVQMIDPAALRCNLDVYGRAVTAHERVTALFAEIEQGVCDGVVTDDPAA